MAFHEPETLEAGHAGSAAALSSRRIVFVGGLHKSGTTPLARWLAQHPDVGAIEKDEGQHLQTVYPTAMAHGGPGRFAFDAAAHLDERSPLATAANAAKLAAEWEPYWDLDRSVLLEKSPPNLIRMRFLKALFPQAAFVMIARHPVATAFATRKWTHTSIRALLEHWLAAYEGFATDARELDQVILVRYEELMSTPGPVLNGVFARLGLAPHDDEYTADPRLNAAYLSAWTSPRDLRRRVGRAALTLRYGRRVGRFGYSLSDADELVPPDPELARILVSADG